MTYKYVDLKTIAIGVSTSVGGHGGTIALWNSGSYAISALLDHFFHACTTMQQNNATSAWIFRSSASLIMI